MNENTTLIDPHREVKRIDSFEELLEYRLQVKARARVAEVRMMDSITDLTQLGRQKLVKKVLLPIGLTGLAGFGATKIIQGLQEDDQSDENIHIKKTVEHKGTSLVRFLPVVLSVISWIGKRMDPKF